MSRLRSSRRLLVYSIRMAMVVPSQSLCCISIFFFASFFALVCGTIVCFGGLVWQNCKLSF